MPRHSLDRAPWTLTGWLPYSWEQAMTMETGIASRAEVGPQPIRVPGSVQQALLDAGVIPDWRNQLDARGGEWVENRHWMLETTLPAGACAGPGPHQLVLAGVDGAATVMLGRRILGEVANTFRPHILDLGQPGPEAHTLRLIFTDQPRALGQVQRTSRISAWKSRYPYVWDWTPRVMQLGTWEGIHLESGPVLHDLRPLPSLDARGAGSVAITWRGNGLPSAARVKVALTDAAGRALVQREVSVADGRIDLTALDVARWWPNGHGDQPLYRLDVTLIHEQAVLDRAERTLGFRSVAWAPCQGAPADARDWLCVVNGKPVFLQGANWVPLRTCFADVTAEEYTARLTTYRDLGFNLLRVWGGSVLERQHFYEQCDALGLMVWQEFPLSSSGIDNHPPDDPTLIADMEQICAHYIGARQHHASLIL